MADMHILETDGTYTKVALKGRLDIEGVNSLEIKFNGAVCAPGKKAVLDISEVSFISSMGIRMLVTAARSLSRRGVRMALVRPQQLVRDAIHSASIDQLIPVADSEIDAIKSIS